MREIMDLQLARQRREEMLREAEARHRARALRASRGPVAGRRSDLAWEAKRLAGHLLKFLGALSNAS